jgi:hypothetical protein
MALTLRNHRALGVAVMTTLALGTTSIGTTSIDAQRERREQHVYVGVTSGDDAPVLDLKPADFTVRGARRTSPCSSTTATSRSVRSPTCASR